MHFLQFIARNKWKLSSAPGIFADRITRHDFSENWTARKRQIACVVAMILKIVSCESIFPIASLTQQTTDCKLWKQWANDVRLKTFRPSRLTLPERSKLIRISFTVWRVQVTNRALTSNINDDDSLKLDGHKIKTSSPQKSEKLVSTFTWWMIGIFASDFVKLSQARPPSCAVYPRLHCVVKSPDMRAY